MAKKTHIDLVKEIETNSNILRELGRVMSSGNVSDIARVLGISPEEAGSKTMNQVVEEAKTMESSVMDNIKKLKEELAGLEN